MTISGFDIHGDFYPFNFQQRYDEGDRFCILKASGGHTFFNGNLGAQVREARAAGLAVGFYHYMYEPSMGGGNVRLEADNFIKTIAPYARPGDTLWLDVEEYPATVGYTGNLGDWVLEFCDTVAAHYGCPVGVYSGTYYLTSTGLSTDKRLARLPFWMASWQEKLPAVGYMAPWTHATMWQWDAHQLDKDLFFGTVEDFRAMGIPVKTDTGGNAIQTGILPDGRPYVQVIFAGKTPRVDGADVADLGIAVESATEPGLILDQSVQHNEFQGWRERR